MKNLLNARDRQNLIDRFAKLTPESERQWGTLSVEQMVCHVTDPMRIALGAMDVKDASNIMTRTALRWLVLAGMPPPKGKVDTFPELDYHKGGGTAITDLATDMETYRSFVERFVERAASGEAFTPSPAFGRLSARAYGRLMYVHMHYHLKQFGV